MRMYAFYVFDKLFSWDFALIFFEMPSNMSTFK